jgi:hypothetical protein
LEREGSKEDKQSTVIQSRVNFLKIKQINERQKSAEKGLIPPLVIWPEGATSNGRHLIKFKKGAFAGENSI